MKREENKELLTEGELIVMKCVWELGDGCLLRDIVAKAEDYGRKWKLQTVATFLKHIEAKGYVRTERGQGRFIKYYVLVSEDECRKESLNMIIDFWSGGDRVKFISDIVFGRFFTIDEISGFKAAMLKKIK